MKLVSSLSQEISSLIIGFNTQSRTGEEGLEVNEKRWVDLVRNISNAISLNFSSQPIGGIFKNDGTNKIDTQKTNQKFLFPSCHQCKNRKTFYSQPTNIKIFKQLIFLDR